MNCAKTSPLLKRLCRAPKNGVVKRNLNVLSRGVGLEFKPVTYMTYNKQMHYVFAAVAG